MTGPVTRHAQVSRLVRFAVLATLSATLVVAGLLLSPRAALAQAAAQTDGAPVIVTPLSAPGVTLQTHTSDITLSTDGTATATAFYRLRNDSASDALATLRFWSPTANGTGSLPGDLSATANGDALQIQPGDGDAQALVTVPANGRTDLRLRYSFNLGSGAVLQTRFDAAALDQGWPGATSFRLTVNVPAEIRGESWLRTTPEGWRFSPSDSAEAAAIQWLYEGDIPAAPLIFEYANPTLWQQIVAQRAAAQAGGVAEWVTLGNSYARLAQEAQGPGVRDRFYGQALAAYGSALDRGAAAAATPATLAPVYTGQARLYRQRIVGSGGAFSAEHAQLLVDSTLAALAALPADAPQRVELQQWLSDGLAIVLRDATDRRDWESALATLDQLEQSGGVMDAATIADERRRILFEQSLQLLEEGQRDEAVAVSGSGIISESLQAPAEAQALFASWQNTVTVDARGAEVVLVGVPTPGRALAAAAAATELANLWAAQDVATVALTAPTAAEPARPVELRINLNSAGAGAALANVTPLRADWALPRTLLAQIAPETTNDATFLRRNVLLKLPLDLRGPGEQWSELAADLTQQADAIEAAGALGDRSDASLENALRAKIQAANYRAEANNWQSLVQNSQILTLLEGPRGAPSDARAWQITVSDPPQTLQYASQGLNTTGLLVLAAAALLLLLLLSGLLWSLL
jgi:hypothetical protein